MIFDPQKLGVVAAVALLSGIVRLMFMQVSSAGAVDHHYWILAARAYRDQRGFPVHIKGKYLLEDERQTYPPGFGVFLALFPEAILRGPGSAWIVVAVDVATLGAIVVAAAALGLDAWGLVALVAVYGLAPVLVAYNTQLTSRGLGNFFLVVKLLAEPTAVASGGLEAATLWLVAVVATAFVILTHKMTTQFMLALWPVWVLTLGSAVAAMIPLFGLFLASLLTGAAYQRLQWWTHAEIVAFWNRNWRFLGVHAFRQSPLYGDPSRPAPGAFHQPGLGGVRRHIVLAVGYLPAAWILPLTLGFAPAPPSWLAAWLLTALAVTLATLLVPSLKCLGGGQLYLFNAVAPAALWWALLLSNPTAPVLILSAVAATATAGSLVLGWCRRTLPGGKDQDSFKSVVDYLQALPATCVAAYPVTAAERIAAETSHAVFWGGHGLGFRTLEPHWPVVRQPIGEALRRYGVRYAALDTRWWPEGEAVFAGELGCQSPERFGTWRLFAVSERQ
jgi:hypothetical protein